MNPTNDEVVQEPKPEQLRVLKGKATKTVRDPRVQRTVDEAAVGPNQPCPCGSGKKFKKCHQYS